jgi:hypothetical protein
MHAYRFAVAAARPAPRRLAAAPPWAALPAMVPAAPTHDGVQDGASGECLLPEPLGRTRSKAEDMALSAHGWVMLARPRGPEEPMKLTAEGHRWVKVWAELRGSILEYFDGSPRGNNGAIKRLGTINMAVCRPAEQPTTMDDDDGGGHSTPASELWLTVGPGEGSGVWQLREIDGAEAFQGWGQIGAVMGARHKRWDHAIHERAAKQAGRAYDSSGAEWALGRDRRRITSGADSDQLNVHIASWNVGNATPPAMLHPWVPSGGGGADLIVVCAQEASYDSSKGASRVSCAR